EPREGHGLFWRGLREVHPHVQARLAETMLGRHHLWGRRRRRYLWDHGAVVPFLILVSPTMRCNLRCPGCYAGEYGHEDDLPTEVFDRVIAQAKDVGVHMMILLGGEPMVYRPLMDLFAKHPDMVFMMFTNGTLVTEAVAREMHRLGNVVPIFSLEGFEEDTDARRGQGTFQKVMQAMDFSRKYGLFFGFSSMLTRDNLDTVIGDPFNDMLVQKGAILGWHFLYMPVGRDPDLSLMPTPEQRERMRTHGASRIRAEKPLFVADFWNDAPWVGGCIAGGRQYIHINSYGDVEPCIFCHFATDNVKEKSLFECLQSPYFKAIQARQPYNENLLRPCMLIDHPHVFRELYKEYQPHPTHPGAEDMVGPLAPTLDRYSQEAGAILDRAWREDFVEKGFVPPVSWGGPKIDVSGNGHNGGNGHKEGETVPDEAPAKPAVEAK
ncbi:MAG: radical SAM protein, partial [Chloroflexota bacterium]